MKGTLYGVGVGPGDPELLTLKAARIIARCDVVGVPDSGTGETVALDIAREQVGDKPVICFDLPMTRDEEALAQARAAVADRLCDLLEEGKTVAFLTLGDPTVYSTYLYLHQQVAARGYPAEIVPGVPSFCAAAAALGIPLCEAEQPLHILPASYPGAPEALELPGVKVLMKSGRQLPALRELLEEKDLLACCAMAERVGMAQQRLYPDLREAPGDSGYLSVVIVKEKAP